MDIWRTNIAALSRHRPSLNKLVQGHQDDIVADLIVNQKGESIAKLFRPDGTFVWAYTTDNPWYDAADHLNMVSPDDRCLVLFTGMGLGYGPLLVLKERPALSQMAIFEPCLDLFCLALKCVDLTPLISSEKVSFYVGDIDFKHVDEQFAKPAALLDTHIFRHVQSFLWRKDVYEPLNTQIFMLFNQLNAKGGTTSQHGEKFFHNRFENLAMLSSSFCLDRLQDKFRGKPAILVAAGPSLDQSIPLLKKAMGRCVLIAGDSSLGPLLNAGIEPDFVTTLDFQNMNFEKLSPFLSSALDVSLVAMIKGCPLITKRFPARHLFLAFPDDIPHLWAMEALGVKSSIPGVSSVGHLSLGLALLLGADPIVFVGQDLAYTRSDADHAAGTVLAGMGVPCAKELYNVASVDGGQVGSSRGFLDEKKLFEDIIKGHPRAYINATAAGAQIEGTEHLGLEDVRSRYLQEEINVRDVVDAGTANEESWDVEKIVAACKDNLKQLNKASSLFQKNKKIVETLRRRLHKKGSSLYHVKRFADFPKDLAKLLGQFDKNNNGLDKLPAVSDHILELTYSSLNENDIRVEENKLIQQNEGYLAWFEAEVGRIQSVNGVRAKAMVCYRDSLQTLVTHFETERKLLGLLEVHRSPDNLMSLAREYCDFGKFQQAKGYLEEALASSADSIDVNLLLGMVYAELLDLEGAKECWLAAQRLNPECVEQVTIARDRFVDNWIATIVEPGLRRPGVLSRWLARFVDILDKDAVLPQSLLLLWGKESGYVEELLAKGDVSGAVKALMVWEVLSERLPEYFYLLSRCWWQKGEGVMAWQVAEKAVALQGGNAAWLAWAARLAFEGGKFDQGVMRLQQAAKLDPTTAVLWEEVGDLLMDNRDFESALSAYEQCFLCLPKRAELMKKIGDCYTALGRVEAAGKAYETFSQISLEDTPV